MSQLAASVHEGSLSKVGEAETPSKSSSGVAARKGSLPQNATASGNALKDLRTSRSAERLNSIAELEHSTSSSSANTTTTRQTSEASGQTETQANPSTLTLSLHGQQSPRQNGDSDLEPTQLKSNQIMTAAVVEPNVTVRNGGGAGSESGSVKPAGSAVSPTTGGRKNSSAPIRYSRIFKKSSQDGNLVLFLPQRELMITETKVEPLMGVALIHENVIQNSPSTRVFLQVVLIFR